jgi:hypothetical protein
MMDATISLTQDDINRAITQFIAEELGFSVDPKEVIIEVKSKQNYKSEWEQAAIRAHFRAVPRST